MRLISKAKAAALGSRRGDSLKQRPALKQKKKGFISWRRFVIVSGTVFLLFLGAAWYVYERMTDKLLEVVMDGTLQGDGSMAAEITNDEAEGTALQASTPFKSAVITIQEVNDAASKVTFEDKLKIGSVLMKHWSPVELKSFKKMLSSGLTIQEKRQIKKQALSELSEEEYNAVILIARKYGLSQGKSYKQSYEETNLP